MEISLGSAPHQQHLLSMLESIGSLTPDERTAIQQLPARVRLVQAGHDIVRDGDTPTECCIVLEGLACRYKTLRGGVRQILSFHFPGDLPDLQSLHLDKMDHGLSAIEKTRAAFISHADIMDLVQRFPALSSLFWRSTLIEGAIFRQWMIGLGRRPALPRMAHLFCEVKARVQANGAAPSDEVRFPVTQADLSDATGLSAVHVNRVMKTLKEGYGVTLRSGRLQSLDWPGLAKSCDFDPGYLHHDKGARSVEPEPASSGAQERPAS